MADTAGWGAWPQGSAMDAAERDTGQRRNAKASAVESHPCYGSSTSRSVNDVPVEEAHTAAWSGGSCAVGRTAKAPGKRATASVSGPRARSSERDWDRAPSWSG